MQRSACDLNVISVITIKSNITLNSNHACALSYTSIHTDCSDSIVHHIPFMVNTNIITGQYTYVQLNTCYYICKCCLG